MNDVQSSGFACNLWVIQAPYIRSAVVDEGRIRLDHWVGLVLCVPFSALTWTVGW